MLSAKTSAEPPRGKYRYELHQLLERLWVPRKGQVPQGQRWTQTCRDKAGGKGIERHGSQASIFSPRSPVQGVGWVCRGRRVFGDALLVYALRLYDVVLCLWLEGQSQHI